MYVSCFLGPTGRGPIDDLPLIDFCIEMGVEADKAGFAVVNVGEQHFNNYEPYSDPFIMGAILAREMKTAYFGTTVIPLTYYNPMRFAEHCNIIDNLTRGKCVLGLSTGALPFTMEAYGVPKVDPKVISLQRLEVALKAWGKTPQDPPLAWKTDLEEGVLATRIMPISHRRGHPLLGFATNTDSTIEMAAKRGWPVQMGRYNLVESARKAKLYKDALEAAGHPQALIDECLAHTNVTKAIVVAETDEEAWALAEQQLRGFMNFTFKVATRRDLDDTRTMKQLWDAKVEGPVDISHAGFTAPEWIQASAFIGSPETVARQMLEYSAAGVDHINARFVYGDFDAETAWRGFHLFAKEVMPRIKAKTLAPPRADQIRDEHLNPSAAPAASLSKLFA